MECDFNNSKYTVKCKHCNADLDFYFSEQKSIREADHKIIDAIVERFNIKVVRNHDLVSYKGSEGLGVYFNIINCLSCSEKYLSVFSAGEFQPARYILVLEGICEYQSSGE